MSPSTITPHDIVIRIDTINQLFNAPEINPFSNKVIDVLGESALTRTRRRLLGRPARNWDNARLVIKLPADKITPDLQLKTTEAVRRYVDAKIEDNMLTIRVSRTRGLIGLLIVIVISVIVLALTTLLLAGPLANVSEVARSWILAFVGIFVWVMLWDPLSKLLFEWVEPWLQSGILRRIKEMAIMIEPQTEQ